MSNAICNPENILEKLRQKDTPLLSYYCVCLVLNRALSNFVTCSPINSGDPISDAVIQFISEESKLTDVVELMSLLHKFQNYLIEMDIPSEFMDYSI